MQGSLRTVGGGSIRPPYVRFKRVAVRDNAKSVEMGYEVTRDEDFACITPPGSRDCVEKVAKDWLKEIEAKHRGGDQGWPYEFVQGFKMAYEQYLQQNEMPPMGTPIRGFMLLQPSEQQRCLSANILTVEDLASANEQAIARIGMGARAMSEKAAAWLRSRGDGSAQVASENINLKVEVEQLREQLAAAQETIRVLERDLKSKKAA